MEPMLWNTPISLIFLYFIFYSFLGWAMETIYCSAVERRFVVRGFLLGPICPIYGVGALLMILPLSFFKDNLVVFYLVATVTLSAWEYFVGWFLETTTHVKYWDYSHFKFNIKGRITLWVCLWWGVLAYVAVFFIHPRTEALFAQLTVTQRHVLAGVLFVLLLVDSVTTIRKLALTARLMRMIEEAGEELRERAREAGEELQGRVEDALDSFFEEHPDWGEGAERLRHRYEQLLEQAEYQSRRFQRRYRISSSFKHYGRILTRLRELRSQKKNQDQG